MKILKYIGAFAVLALLGLSSCTTDVLTSNNSASQGKGRKVNLTIGGVAKTRSANLGGFDREKAIDGTKLYAVVFDQQGKFSKTYQITDYETTGHTCSFTLDDAGVYYGYIVANTSKGSALTSLTKGTSTEDDFFNIIEDTDPGADLASSTNFLMTSKRTLLDVDGDADTSLGTITLTRAVVRIDIDATAITGLAITKVEVQNRYKKSLIIRGNTPDNTGLSGATPTDTKTYTRGTNTGEVPALDGASTGQDHAIVTDQEWQGVIYGYENINPANTVVKITHTLNGVASTTTVNFSDANSGAGQALKRNNIYTVTLTDGAPNPNLQDITATITVTDWDTSTNLSYTDLTDHAKPDFEVTSSHVASGYTSSNLNPSRVHAKKTDSPTEITLQVTSQGKVASEVSFVDKNGSAYDFLGAEVNGSIEQVGATALVDGKIVQNFKITIPQTIVRGLSGTDYFTFKVHNVFDDTSAASREFVVRASISVDDLNYGDVIYADGSYSSTYINDANNPAVGVVVYKSDTPTAICETGISDARQTNAQTVIGKALVMCLENIGPVYSPGTKLAWGDRNTSEATAHPSIFTSVGTNVNTAVADLKGYEKTYTMAEETRTSVTNHSDHAVASLCWDYKPSVITGTIPEDYLYGSSGWFLPSVGQWLAVVGQTINVEPFSPPAWGYGSGKSYLNSNIAVNLKALLDKAEGGSTTFRVNTDSHGNGIYDYETSSETSTQDEVVICFYSDGVFLSDSWGDKTTNNNGHSNQIRVFLAY